MDFRVGRPFRLRCRMNRRFSKASTFAARQVVSTWIKALYTDKATPSGLPEDVLVRALEGYGGLDLSWPAVRDKGRNFRDYVSEHIRDCTIRCVFHRPIGNKAPAASVSIFRLMPNPLRSSETLFGACSYTFTFWPSGVWFLSTFDPLCTTDHLHQRLVERIPDHSFYRSADACRGGQRSAQDKMDQLPA
jgi:hypothetical protein